ncbi:molybdenum cofactor guanylyltransferase [Maricaulis salignorans]|uniref:Molybdenum cofactor guanylyltransferase n=1 Tax=Maricaulis salignorans TaxID=144026 RepID=A0A1G9LVC9_9PROT|nr:molybdenum cofactor guanylyltransferase [Maricaulis salignorans]SDL66052.1 molybdenum cofactor guanylyltransferase [Maricaulis salignorans]
MIQAVDMGRIAGLILAGGQSSRMGRDKALLTWQGETLLSRARTLLRNAGVDMIFVGGRPDQPDGLPDSEPHAGPARAILDAAGLLRDRCDQMLVIPVDMPLLGPDQLSPLLGGHPGRAHCWQGHPLPALIPVAACDGLANDAIYSIKRLLTTLDANPLAVAPILAGQPDPFSNINTPEALASLDAISR